MDRELKYLGLIIIVAWLLVLAGTGIVFKLIVPFNYFHSFFLDGVAQALFAMILVIAWIWIMVLIRNTYVRKLVSKGNNN